MDKPLNTVDQQIGQKLRLRRELLALTQDAVADQLQVSSQTVAKYEAGTIALTARRLAEFSRVLQLPVAEMFDGNSTTDLPTETLAADMRRLCRLAAPMPTHHRANLLAIARAIAAPEAE